MWRGVFRAFVIAAAVAFCGILTAGAILYAANGTGGSTESTWKTLGGDFDRAGLSDSNGPEAGCVRWRFEADGAVAASVTIGAGRRVHIACEDGKLYTLDSEGGLLWKYDVNSPLVSSPTIGRQGCIYVGSEEGKLYAIDADGNLLWTYATGGAVYSSPAVSPDGNDVYVCSTDGVVYALTADGNDIWTFTTKGPGELESGAIFASPAIGSDGSIYIGGIYDPNLYALDPNDGSIKWICCFAHPLDPGDPNSDMVGGRPFASPVVGEDGTIYQTLLYDSNLYAIDPNDGEIIWSTDMADADADWFDANYAEDYEGYADGWSEPALGPDGTIYVSLDDPYLRAVDPNGAIKWVRRLDDLGGFTLTVGADGLVYTACDDGTLYAVKPDGSLAGWFETDGWLNFPVIAAENLIIVSDGNDGSFRNDDRPNVVWAISRERCRDMNFDGVIDFNDVAIFASYWLDSADPCAPSLPTGDVDGDRRVAFEDLALIAKIWKGSEKILTLPVPGRATDPDPPNGASDVLPTALNWTPGIGAESHDLYFGTSFPLVFIENRTSTTFELERLSPSMMYYWRIDSVNRGTKTTGETWNFSTPTGGTR
jgi:outer membrane protein assembly factor BamB